MKYIILLMVVLSLIGCETEEEKKKNAQQEMHDHLTHEFIRFLDSSGKYSELFIFCLDRNDQEGMHRNLEMQGIFTKKVDSVYYLLIMNR